MPQSDVDTAKLFRTTEELEYPEEASIEGSIPEWVRGTFLRVGPGKFDLPNFTLNHWLDGYAILSKFDIERTTVKFYKRFLQSDALQRAEAAGRPCITEFGTKAFPDPNKNFLSRVVSSIMPEMTDNDVNTIFTVGREYFAANDSCFFRKVDPDSLSTGEKYDSNKLFGLNGMSAHPLTDESGDIYNVGFSIITGLKLSVIKIPCRDKALSAKEMMKSAKVLCSISSSYGTGSISFVHSFGMTRNFIIIIEQPFVASISAIAAALIKGHSVKDWLTWRPQETNKFHIIEKSSGKVVRSHSIQSAEPFFFLHFVNCFESDTNQIVVDLIALNSPNILDGMYLHKLRNKVVEKNDQPSARRFVLPLFQSSASFQNCSENQNIVTYPNCTATAVRKGSVIIVAPHLITEPGCEMPVVNRRFQCQNYKYFYVNGTIADNVFSNAIYKINPGTGDQLFWRGSRFLYPGEPIFVANPHGKDEDDGILISAVSNVESGGDDLLIWIDAKSMKEIARAKFKAHVPSALHGIFISKS